MNVKIVCANTLRAAKIAVDEKLKCLDLTNLDEKNYVIVPDRSTLDAENALVDAVGGSFNTQVVTFRSLANKYVKTDLNYLNKQNGILLLSQIIESKSKSFLCFVNSGNSAGFAAKIYEVVCALKYAKISPERLSAEDLPHRLKSKLADIKSVYSEYAEATQNRYFDSADSLNMLIEALKDADLSNCSYFVYDFLNFTAQEKEILSVLAKKAKALTVAVAKSDLPTHRLLFDNAAFLDVVDLCTREGIKYSTEYFVSHAGQLAKHIYSNVYCSGKITTMKIDEGKLFLQSGTTVDDEALALAQFIDNYVKNGGRYKDIKVVCSSTAEYSYSLARRFFDYDVPFYLDEKQSLDKTVLSRYLLSFLTCFKTNFKLESVLEFAKNPLFGQDVFAFENFCLKYNVNYNYEEFKFGREDVLFEQAEKTRQKLVSIFGAYDIKKVAVAEEYARQLTEFAAEQKLSEKISDLCEYLVQIGQRDEKARLAQVENKVLRVLEQATLILGDQPVSVERYIKSLTAALASQTVSVVPDKSDCVSVCNLDKGKNHNVKVVCLVGANEGKLPAIKKNCTLLSDSDLMGMSKAGLKVEPSIESENRKEKFSLFNLLCEPTDILYVSFRSKQGEQGGPSPFVTTLKKIFRDKEGGEWQTNGFVYPFLNKKTLGDLAVVACSRARDGLQVKGGDCETALRLYGKQAQKYARFDNNVPNVKNGAQLFFKGDAISVTKIEDYYSCPFSMFLKQGLGLKEREIAEFKANDFGTVLHAVFERYVNRLIDGKSTENEDAAQIFDAVVAEEKYAAATCGIRGAAFCAKLKKEAIQVCQRLKAQIQNSDFKPIKTEFLFGFDKATALKLSVGDKTLYLKGIIDRVDAVGDKALVLDYKTGNASFSENCLYVGTKLQLFVYSLAVKETLGLTPIGCFYILINDNYDQKDKKTFIGRVVADTDVLSSIEKDFYQNNASRLFSASLTKDGAISKIGKTCMSREAFADCEAYAAAIIKNANKLLQEGYVQANPVADACTYCKAIGICGIGDTRLIKERKEADVSLDFIGACVRQEEKNQ